MKRIIILCSLGLLFVGCGDSSSGNGTISYEQKQKPNDSTKSPELNLKQANRLARLPLACAETEYPNKLSQTLTGDDDLKPPHVLHPAFYGCFDWHSAVHGHWSMVFLLKHYPGIDAAEQMKDILLKHLTKEHIHRELEYFKQKQNKSWERTYGWAWLLKLAEELHSWKTPLAHQLEENLQPLAAFIAHRYIEFLPKLNYPIRVGEHPNTAFGLSFAYDYALALGEDSLRAVIESRARDFYREDKGCPVDWEPGGYDFLSPCLEEVDIMRRILPAPEFNRWLAEFMPALTTPDFDWEPGQVSDRTDGKLVHLDGLNFSRAWCLYGLAHQYKRYHYLRGVADKHIRYSLPHLVGDDYEGGHWLGSFALYALKTAHAYD